MPKIKLDKQDIEVIKDLCINTILLDSEIAELFGVSRKHINSIRNGKRWNYEFGEHTNNANRNELARRIILHR